MLTRKCYPFPRSGNPRIVSMQSPRIFVRSPDRSALAKVFKNRYLPSASAIAIFVILLLTIPSGLHGQRSSRSAQPAEASLTVAEQYLLAAANQDRANQGLPALRLDPVLTRASAFHAREMAVHESISHQFPGEPELADRGSNAGEHFSLIAENVGEAPTSVIIHDMWMHSPGHRANLLDPNVNAVGIAIVTRDNQLYAVEDFVSTVEPLTLIQQEQTVAAILAQSGMQVVGITPGITSNARATCTMSVGYVGSRRPWYIMRYTASALDEIPIQLKARLTSGKYHQAVVGACSPNTGSPFASYNIAVLLYP